MFDKLRAYPTYKEQIQSAQELLTQQNWDAYAAHC